MRRDPSLPIDQRFKDLVAELQKPLEERSDDYRLIMLDRRKGAPRKDERDLRYRLIAYAYQVYGKHSGTKTARFLGVPKGIVQYAMKSGRTNSPAMNVLVQKQLENVALDITAEGVAGVIQKLDRLASGVYEKLMERIERDEEKGRESREVVPTKDLVAAFRVSLEEIRELMFRMKQKKQEADATALTDDELRRSVNESRSILKQLDDPQVIDVTPQ